MEWNSVSRALSRSCPLKWIFLYAPRNAPTSPNIRHDIRVIKSLSRPILLEGQMSAPNGNARNLFALLWRVPDQRRCFAREQNNEMYFFVHTSRTNMFPLFYWPRSMLSSRKWKFSRYLTRFKTRVYDLKVDNNNTNTYNNSLSYVIQTVIIYNDWYGNEYLKFIFSWKYTGNILLNKF